MRILLVYPKVEETFWSFKHALKIVKRKAAFPPLGALTVAAMLPDHWEKRVVDMNVRNIKEDDIKWADYVFISAMVAQQNSAREVVNWCKTMDTKTVGGGPLFFSYSNDFSDMDHIVVGEGEAILPKFLEDLENGVADHFYHSKEHPSLESSPVPSWELIRFKDYVTMSIQYSRGCPYNCEFCDIIVMNGRIPRTKSNDQILTELESLYRRGWKGSVFIVDDNFIGNKKKVKSLLREVIVWQEEHKRPFSFFTEASVDLAEDPELMDLMVEAGFNKVFLGLETPAEESLQECGKKQNLKRNLSESVRIIQKHGLNVMGGFIIGFDNDPMDIFQRQVEFIQNNGVVTAMIGLLTALPGTRLYQRLQREGRLLFKSSGNNTDICGSLNFIPKMDRESILKGYQWVMDTLYSPEQYYERILNFLKYYQPKAKSKILFSDITTLLRSFWYLGIWDQRGTRKYYWKLLKKALLNYRNALADVVTLAIYGYHFRKLFWSRSAIESFLEKTGRLPKKEGA